MTVQKFKNANVTFVLDLKLFNNTNTPKERSRREASNGGIEKLL